MKEININFDSKTNIELLHECGEREDVAMSQYAVTKELDKLGKKIDDFEQKIDDGEIPEVGTPLILEKEGEKITIDPTGNHETPSIRSHGEEAPGLGMVERHGFVLQEDFIGLVSKNGDKVGIFLDENNGIYHSYFIGVDRGGSGRFGFNIHGRGGDNGVAVSQGKLWVNDTFDPTDIEGGEAASVGYVDRAASKSEIFGTLASLGVLRSESLEIAASYGEKPEIVRSIDVYVSESGSAMEIDPYCLPEFNDGLYLIPLEYDGRSIGDAILDCASCKLIPIIGDEIRDLVVDLPDLGNVLLASQQQSPCVNYFEVYFTAGDYNQLEYNFRVPFEDGMTWIDWVYSIYPRLHTNGLADWEDCNVYYDKSSAKVHIGFQYAGWSGTEIVKDIYEIVQCEVFDMGEWA